MDPLDPKLLMEVAAIDVQSPSRNIYTDITSAKLVLNERLGPVDVSKIRFLANSTYTVDLGKPSIEDTSLQILPIVFDKSTDEVHSLLLKTCLEAGDATFERVGTARLDRTVCPEELRWTFALADFDQPFRCGARPSDASLSLGNYHLLS
jgi:hypothetical protein